MPELGGRDSKAYRRANHRMRRTETVCWLCGELIDVTLRYTHPRSWTADHVQPLALGGELMGERRAAHRDCNARRGTAEVAPAKLKTTRPW